MMVRQLQPDDHVRLCRPVPETPLCTGDVGTVCARWGPDGRQVEVEFCLDTGDLLRVLLEERSVEPDEEGFERRTAYAALSA